MPFGSFHSTFCLDDFCLGGLHEFRIVEFGDRS